MQFIFSLATAIIWSLVTILELTSAFPEPFAFQPIRTLLFGSIGVMGIVTATLHYDWQLWFARITAGLTTAFLIASNWFDLLPQGQLKIPTLISLILWTIFAAVAGYQKKV